METRFKKLQGDFEQQLIACEQLNNENQSKASELKVLQHESIVIVV